MPQLITLPMDMAAVVQNAEKICVLNMKVGFRYQKQNWVTSHENNAYSYGNTVNLYEYAIKATV
jgi:hypothetical protein